MLALDAIRRALRWALSASEAQTLCRKFRNLYRYRIRCFGKHIQQTEADEHENSLVKSIGVWLAE